MEQPTKTSEPFLDHNGEPLTPEQMLAVLEVAAPMLEPLLEHVPDLRRGIEEAVPDMRRKRRSRTSRM